MTQCPDCLSRKFFLLSASKQCFYCSVSCICEHCLSLTKHPCHKSGCCSWPFPFTEPHIQLVLKVPTSASLIPPKPAHLSLSRWVQPLSPVMRLCCQRLFWSVSLTLVLPPSIHSSLSNRRKFVFYLKMVGDSSGWHWGLRGLTFLTSSGYSPLCTVCMPHTELLPVSWTIVLLPFAACRTRCCFYLICPPPSSPPT